MRILDLQDWRGVEWVLQIDRFSGGGRPTESVSKLASRGGNGLMCALDIQKALLAYSQVHV
jgi:hypothetical protein